MTPWIDPIVDEIHRYRAERAERFNYDIEAMVADTNAFFEQFKKECVEKGIVIKEVKAPQRTSTHAASLGKEAA